MYLSVVKCVPLSLQTPPSQWRRSLLLCRLWGAGGRLLSGWECQADLYETQSEPATPLMRSKRKHWPSTSSAPSLYTPLWCSLAGAFYRCEERAALQAVSSHLQREDGMLACGGGWIHVHSHCTQSMYRIVWFLSACAYLENSKKYAPKSQAR